MATSQSLQLRTECLTVARKLNNVGTKFEYKLRNRLSPHLCVTSFTQNEKFRRLALIPEHGKQHKMSNTLNFDYIREEDWSSK